MDKWGTSFRLLGVGFYIVACIVGGILGGLWLDKALDTRPIFLLIGLVLGLVASFWGVYQMLRPMIDENKRNRK
jgi:ATP synthase protein I